MFKPKTYAQLCQSMQCGAIVEIDDVIGVINGIDREDGSGTCWNVHIVDPTDTDGDTIRFVRAE